MASATGSSKMRTKDSPLSAIVRKPLKGQFSKNLEIRNSLEGFEMNCTVV